MSASGGGGEGSFGRGVEWGCDERPRLRSRDAVGMNRRGFICAALGAVAAVAVPAIRTQPNDGTPAGILVWQGRGRFSAEREEKIRTAYARLAAYSPDEIARDLRLDKDGPGWTYGVIE